MNKKKFLYVYTVFLTVLLVTQAVGAIGVLPPPPPPQEKPIVYTPSYTSDSTTEVTIGVTVCWRHAESTRQVHVYVSGKGWYLMYKVHEYTSYKWRYERQITGLSPTSSYSYKIKASETIFPEETLTTTTGYYTITSCKPSLSVSVDASEKYAVLNWAVTSWGREGKGSSPQITIKYRHDDGDIEWDVVRSTQSVPSGDSGSDTIQGFALRSVYRYNVYVTHVIDSITLSATSESTFTTDSFTVDKRYALIINLNGDTESNGDYDAHHNEYLRMINLVNSKGFDFIKDIEVTDESVEDFTNLPSSQNPGYLSWPYWTEDDDKDYTQDWERCDSDDLVFIYLVGHGRVDDIGAYQGLVLDRGDGTDTISGTAIGNTINEIAEYGKMVIVIESCYSGKLVQFLEDEDRLVITSSDDEHDAEFTYTDGEWRCPFSYVLYTQLAAGANFYTAYDQSCYELKLDQKQDYQKPMLAEEYPPDDGVDSFALDLKINWDGQLAWALTILGP